VAGNRFKAAHDYYFSTIFSPGFGSCCVFSKKLLKSTLQSQASGAPDLSPQATLTSVGAATLVLVRKSHYTLNFSVDYYSMYHRG